MTVPINAFEAFGIRWVTQQSAASIYNWLTWSATCPDAWRQEGKALVADTWQQIVDGMTAPKTADIAAVAAAVGEGVLSVIPGGAAIAAGIAVPIAMGITALKTADEVIAALLPKDAMLFPEHWWIPGWALTVLSAGRFLCINGTLPEADGDPMPGICVCQWRDVAEVAGTGHNWAVWLSAPDAWLYWANSVVVAEKTRRRI